MKIIKVQISKNYQKSHYPKIVPVNSILNKLTCLDVFIHWYTKFPP